MTADSISKDKRELLLADPENPTKTCKPVPTRGNALTRASPPRRYAAMAVIAVCALAAVCGLVAIAVDNATASATSSDNSAELESTKRALRQPIVSLGAALPESAYRAGCEVGTGFDIKAGCPASAVEQIMPCKDDTDPGPCLETLNDISRESVYTTKVSSTSDFHELQNTVVSAEGSGWGVSVSASVSAMTQSGMSETSTTFVIGQSADVYRTRIRGAQNLKLTEGARNLLKNKPKEFLHQYGSNYVSEMTYGASFFGSMALWSKSSSSSSSLDVFAKFDAHVVFVDVSVSAEFQKDVSESSSTVSIKTTASTNGGGLIPIDTTNPQDLGNTFNQWHQKLIDDPKTATPIRMVWRGWYDLAEVQQIINAQHDASVRRAFAGDSPGPTILRLLASEYQSLQYVRTQIDHAQEWECAHNPNNTLRADLADYRDIIDTQTTTMEGLREADIVEVQAEVTHGDYSWFKNRNDKLLRELVDKLEAAGC